MKTKTAILLSFVICLAVHAQKLDGNWKGAMTGPNGAFELLYTFKADSNVLSGNATSAMGSLPLENGKVSGNTFSFDVNVNGQVFSNTGVLDGDMIKLTVPMMEQPLVLTRVVEKSKIDGQWIGKISGPQGDMEITFYFTVDGNKLTGKNSTMMGESILINGAVNGDEFSFDVEFQGMTIGHKCRYLNDDTIDVIVVMMGQEMPMKLVRVVQ
ncbi:MAG TPA: hypothetical protein PKZ83_16445 [bacterium]|nr:hypothetical protein [bacterium]HQJ66253.1 hypothetical protein [bacterium]